LGHAFAPAGSDIVPKLTVSTAEGKVLQLDVGHDGSFPLIDGHGGAPGGNVTVALPPSPVFKTSVPQIAPTVEGSLPGTAKQDVGVDTAPAKVVRIVATTAIGASESEHSTMTAAADDLWRKVPREAPRNTLRSKNERIKFDPSWPLIVAARSFR
jgi:hypothetical protein